jgi:hypothetical protein
MHNDLYLTLIDELKQNICSIVFLSVDVGHVLEETNIQGSNKARGGQHRTFGPKVLLLNYSSIILCSFVWKVWGSVEIVLSFKGVHNSVYT